MDELHDFPHGEIDALDLVQTIQSPGWGMIELRLHGMLKEAVLRLRNGGKDRHDVNAGYLRAIEEVQGKTKEWLGDAMAVLDKETA